MFILCLDTLNNFLKYFGLSQIPLSSSLHLQLVYQPRVFLISPYNQQVSWMMLYCASMVARWSFLDTFVQHKCFLFRLPYQLFNSQYQKCCLILHWTLEIEPAPASKHGEAETLSCTVCAWAPLPLQKYQMEEKLSKHLSLRPDISENAIQVCMPFKQSVLLGGPWFCQQDIKLGPTNQTNHCSNVGNLTSLAGLAWGIRPRFQCAASGVQLIRFVCNLRGCLCQMHCWITLLIYTSFPWFLKKLSKSLPLFHMSWPLHPHWPVVTNGF